MHRIIGAIVYAPDRDDAKTFADEIFGDLCGDKGPYDYFDVMQIFKAGSPKGESLLKAFMKKSRETFDEHLNHLREALAKLSNEEAFSALGDFDVRWRASQVGAYKHGVVFLYAPKGHSIRNEEELFPILWKTEESAPSVLDWMPEGSAPQIPDDVWIVTADVHH
jgi:hypothetical protein